MKRILLVIVAIFVLFYLGCNSDRDFLKETLKEYEPTTQIFKSNSDSLIRFKGEKGTILKIDPSVLRHKDGSVVEGEIEVRLLELTTTEDLLRANAQTLSKDKWLISGGAYNIRIFSDNKELKIVTGKNIQVDFPKIASEKMKLFNGNRDVEGNMNWELSNQELKSLKYPVVIQEDSSFIRFDNQYKIDVPVDTIVYRNLKEKLSVAEVQDDYKEIDSLIVKNDTIYSYIFSRRLIISEMMKDSVLSPAETDVLIKKKKSTREDIFIRELYSTIAISKLGWINVDRFYPEITNRTYLKITSDIIMDYEHIYAADTENNTLLNIYKDEKGIFFFNAPLETRFAIIAFGVKGEQFYGYKKIVLIDKRTTHEIEYKKENIEEMDAYFKLN